MRLTYMAAICAVTLTGCGHALTSCGWEFRVGRPSIQYVPAAMQMESGGIGMMPLGSAPSKLVPGPMPVSCEIPRGNDAGPPRRYDVGDGVQGGCGEQLQQMRYTIERLQRRLDGMPASKMPAGPPTE